MKTVMLTGAGGFIGSHIAEAMLQRGFRVRMAVRRRTPLVRELERRGAAVLDIGLRNEVRGLQEALRGAEAVVHCAAAVRASSLEGYYRANVGLTRTLLDLVDGERLFLLLSSQAAAGPSPADSPLDEHATPTPINTYGRTKLKAEAAARTWQGQRGGRCVVLRPCAVYGPRDRDFLVLFRAVARGVAILPGDGRQRISLLNVHDLVRAVMTVLEHPRSGTYFVCGDESPSWRELARLIQRVLEKDRVTLLSCPPALAGWASFAADALAGALGRRPFLLCRDKVLEMRHPAWICSSEALRRDTEWRPAVPLSQGLRETAVWYREAGQL